MEEGLIPRGLKGKFFIEVFPGTANLSFAIVHAGNSSFLMCRMAMTATSCGPRFGGTSIVF
jgi:hypothetical protein